MARKTPLASLLRLAAVIFVLLACVLVFVPVSPAQTSTSVIIIPASVSVRVPGGMQQFDARVTSTHPNRNVRWTLSGPGCRGAACGTLSETISTSGSAITYTAPAKLPNPPMVTLTATSAANSSAKARSSVTLTSDVSLTLTTASNNAVRQPLNSSP